MRILIIDRKITMSNSPQAQKDAVINLYQSFQPDGQAHKFRLLMQVIDNKHDSASGTFPLGEITMNADGNFSETENLLFDSPVLASYTSEVIKNLNGAITHKFLEIAKSDKSAKRAQLELQKAAIEAQLKDL